MKKWHLIVVVVVLFLIGFVVVGRFGFPWFYSEDTTSGWVYESSKYGFRMRLPSRDWEQIQKPNSDVAFYNRKRSVLAGVYVTKGQEQDFQKAKEAWQTYLKSNSEELLSEPEIVQGEMESGNPYAYWLLRAKGEKGRTVFLAKSFVWCKSKGLTVSVMIEGPLTMTSKAGKSAERNFYHNAVQVICLSIE